MASWGEDSLSKWSIIWMQPCAACHLMLLDVAKEFNHGNYGISESNWIQNSSPTKKKHKIIHSETSLQHEKKQNNKEANIKPIISSLLPSRKTHQNLSKCKIHSLPSKEKKTLSKMMCGSHPCHLFLVFLFPVFLGDPFCMTKLRL